MTTTTMMAALRAIIAGLAFLGFLGIANAVPLAPAEDNQLTTQYIYEKYVQPVHHVCWEKKYAISRDCCGFNYYGACTKYCTHYGYRTVCKKHRRYYKKRRYRKKRYY